jgi:hypothetical protein
LKVKGTAILDLVRIIRSEKQRDWDQYLEPEDMDIARGTIFPTKWYPGDSFWRIAWAVAKEVGENKSDNHFIFGRLSARSFLEVYKRLLVEGDPIASIEKCIDVWRTFYDSEGAPFKKTEIEKGPDWVKLTAYEYPDMTVPEVRSPYFFGLTGYFQEIAETALGKEIKNKIDDKGDHFEISFNWS